MTDETKQGNDEKQNVSLAGNAKDPFVSILSVGGTLFSVNEKDVTSLKSSFLSSLLDPDSSFSRRTRKVFQHSCTFPALRRSLTFTTQRRQRFCCERLTFGAYRSALRKHLLSRNKHVCSISFVIPISSLSAVINSIKPKSITIFAGTTDLTVSTVWTAETYIYY